MPLELRRIWTFWPDYTDVSPASCSICVDGEIGTVVKTYREVNTCTLLNDFFKRSFVNTPFVKGNWRNNYIRQFNCQGPFNRHRMD